MKNIEKNSIQSIKVSFQLHTIMSKRNLKEAFSKNVEKNHHKHKEGIIIRHKRNQNNVSLKNVETGAWFNASQT